MNLLKFLKVLKMTNKTLRERCVEFSPDNDGFVGLKADTSNALVYFPIGYQLGETEDELRKDILHLLATLRELKDDKKGHISKKNYKETDDVDFPLNAFLEIIYYYLENGYYKEVDPVFRTRERGKINWSKTIKQQRPLLSLNKDNNTYSPVYTQFTVRESRPNENKEITRIHQHCVYRSFKIIGWIFTSYMPPKPEGKYNPEKFLYILRRKLSNTNNDKKKRLFQSMIEMISETDEEFEGRMHFGTNKFEDVWEKLIDKAFNNVEIKKEFYPSAHWKLSYDENHKSSNLRPDSIMLDKENKIIYILDAKYYKYGVTKATDDLPNSADINKQISYGEYVFDENIYGSYIKYLDSNERFRDIYNAFLIPYNKYKKDFKFNNSNFENVGEAKAPWKDNERDYEHIQAILVDTKFLINNYKSKSKDNMLELGEAIQNAFEKNQEEFKTG